MKGKRYTEEQIIGILREVESGTSVADVCRAHNVSAWSISRWRRKFSGMDVSDAKRLRAVESENSRLKRIVAQMAIDMEILKEAASKNGRPFRQAWDDKAYCGCWDSLPASRLHCSWGSSFERAICWQEVS